MDEHLIVAHNPWMDRRSWQHTCMDGRMDEHLVSWDTHPMDGWVDTTHMHGRMDDNLVSFIRCKPVNTIHHVPIRIRPDVVVFSQWAQNLPYLGQMGFALVGLLCLDKPMPVHLRFSPYALLGLLARSLAARVFLQFCLCFSTVLNSVLLS